MKSIFKFLFFLLTIILLSAYSVGISEKIRKPTFKNLPLSDYVWLGIILLILIYLNIKWLYLDRINRNQNYSTSTSHVPPGATMQTIKQYDVFLLAKDLNQIITKGMQGVILEIWDENGFEIEFVREDGTNYEYDGASTFTVDRSFIGEIIWTMPESHS